MPWSVECNVRRQPGRHPSIESHSLPGSIIETDRPGAAEAAEEMISEINRALKGKSGCGVIGEGTLVWKDKAD